MDVRKNLTDAGYIAVGLGVLGYQQARTRAGELREQVERSTRCAGGVRDQVETSVRTARDQVETNLRTARDQVETGTRAAIERASEVGKRVEPLVDQARGTIGELPEQVARTLEPVRQRVRDLVAPAA